MRIRILLIFKLVDQCQEILAFTKLMWREIHMMDQKLKERKKMGILLFLH